MARHVLEAGAADLVLRSEHRLSAVEKRRLSRILHRRLDGVPLQYVLGSVDFAGIFLRIVPGVFIPRPETEGLVEHVLAFLGPDPACTVVDLATGSGAVALALASARPRLHAWGTDVSPEAVRLAQANARRLQVGDRVLFVQGDLAAPLGTLRPELPVRVVVSNPPYISLRDRSRLDAEVVDHEPHAALFAGKDGLAVIRRIGPVAAGLLSPGGLLALEIGEESGPRVRDLLSGDARWRDVRIEPDLAGRDRYALAVRT
jgi:release factor glutamine methyltransferase